MKAPRTRSQELRRAANGHAPKALDSGEVRIVLFTAVGLAFFLYFIRLILLPFVLAVIVAYICTSPLDWAAQRTRLPRWLLAIALYVVLVGCVGSLLFFAGQHVVAETKSIASGLQGMIEKFAGQLLGNGSINLFGQSMNASQIAKAVVDQIRDWFGQNNQFAIIAGYGLASIMGVFLTMVLLFYFLVSGRSVARGVLWIVPPHRRHLVERIWARLDPVLMRYFLGVIAVVIYATIAAYIGLGLILHIHHAVLLALLTGILEAVPVIGPTSAAVIAGLVSLQTATGVMSILAYALYATILRLSIDQIIGPVVLGHAGRVHPVLIIFCFLAGGVLLGIPGVILAVPVALTINNTLATLYGDDRP
jgi:predicted PurR-regulated permease PerM